MASDFHTHFCHPGKTELVNNGKGTAPLWSLAFHPWETAVLPEISFEDLKQCSALGELGFDKFRGALPYPHEQLALFRRLLTVGRENKKAIVLHAVGSFEQLMKETAAFSDLRFLVHGYARHNTVLLAQLLDAGFYVSLHPDLISDNAIRTFLKENPASRVGLETDDRSDLVIDELYAQMDVPGFESSSDSHFREFLQL